MESGEWKRSPFSELLLRPRAPLGGEGGETGGGRAKKIHRRRVRKEEMEACDMALGDCRHGCPYRNGSQFFEIHSGLLRDELRVERETHKVGKLCPFL